MLKSEFERMQTIKEGDPAWWITIYGCYRYLYNITQNIKSIQAECMCTHRSI